MSLPKFKREEHRPYILERGMSITLQEECREMVEHIDVGSFVKYCLSYTHSLVSSVSPGAITIFL